MTAAAFRATYADWKLIKGRKVVQVVFEVPLELADHAYGVLGGMPNPAGEVWCGVARLQVAGAGTETAGRLTPVGPESGAKNPGGEHEVSTHDLTHHRTEPGRDEPAPGRARKSFHELSPAQQAGILCNEEPFWLFLKERENIVIRSSEQCADVIRNFLNIKSRSDIEKDHRTRVLWNQYVTDYRAWQKEVEVIG